MRKAMIAGFLLLAACNGTETQPAARNASVPPRAEPSGIEPTPAGAQPSTLPAPATEPQATATGAIAGMLAYPSEALPAMRVCAFELAEGASHCISTTPGQSDYRIDGVPHGDYQVLAYPREGNGAPGGYTGCVDDLSVNCTDHDLGVVVVERGRTTPDIDPVDFYAGDTGVDWPVEP